MLTVDTTNTDIRCLSFEKGAQSRLHRPLRTPQIERVYDSEVPPWLNVGNAE
jgi:hypothetical protein